MEREKISRKRRGIAVLTLAAAPEYLPQIQVSRQIRKEEEEAVEMYVREEKEENKRKTKKAKKCRSRNRAVQIKICFGQLILRDFDQKIDKSCGSGFGLRLRCSGCARAG